MDINVNLTVSLNISEETIISLTEALSTIFGKPQPAQQAKELPAGNSAAPPAPNAKATPPPVAPPPASNAKATPPPVAPPPASNAKATPPAAAPAENKSGIKIEKLRALLGEKIEAHREAIRNKLAELGAKNITVLEPTHYQVMHDFMQSLP